MEKIIHQIWIGKYKMPSREKKLAEEIKTKHPDWQYMFWDDEAVSKLEMPPNVEEAYRFWSNEHKMWASPDYVIQADILRFYLIHKFGGVYLDVDFELKEVFNVLNLEKYDAFICWHDSDTKVETLPNNIFGGTKGNKLFTYIVEKIVPNRHYTPHQFGKMVREYYGIEYQTSSHLGENGILKKFDEDNIFYMPYNYFHDNYCFHHALYSWSEENKAKFKSGNYE
jgi:mannosyltransferase OCH1-like enzyme